MSNSKVHSLLQSFEIKDWSKAESYLIANRVSPNSDIMLLFNYYVACINKNTKADKKSAYRLLFPQQKYNDVKLRLVHSKLFKQLESYLLFQLSTHNNSWDADILLLNYYRQKKLDKLFNAQRNKLNKIIDHNSRWSEKKFQNRLQMEISSYQSDSLEKRKKKLNLVQISNSVDQIYYAQKLKFACLALSHQAVYKHDYSLNNVAWVIERVHLEGLEEVALIGSYYWAYQTISNPDSDQFFQGFIDYIKLKEEELERDDLQTLYFFAINHCIRKLNTGEKDYGLLGLDIYERTLENNILLIDGFLSRFSYRNIAMMAIRAEQYEWAEKFSHDYVDRLRKDDKQSAYRFNLALVHYYKEDFSTALSHIQEADFKDQLIHLAAKTLQAKIYYELEAEKALNSLLDSLDIYLIRNKIIGYHKQNYKNIIKYFKRLSRLNPYDKDAKSKLLKKVNNEEVFTEKKWIIEKLNN